MKILTPPHGGRQDDFGENRAGKKFFGQERQFQVIDDSIGWLLVHEEGDDLKIFEMEVGSTDAYVFSAGFRRR